MQTYQVILRSNSRIDGPQILPFIPDLLLIFGNRDLLKSTKLISELRNVFSEAIMSGCSTSGEIKGSSIYDDTIVVNAIKFHESRVCIHEADLKKYSDSEDIGKSLVEKFDSNQLAHLFVLSEGLKVNGSSLVKGLKSGLEKQVGITGGMASDGDKLLETYVIGNDGKIHRDRVCIIGFYGKNLRIGYGSRGGWDSFGMDRLVTKSKMNVLFEIDNKPALDLYKQYLGERANELPSAGLFFPLSIRTSSDSIPIVRTIIGVNEEKKSLTFAGNIPEGSYVKLMKANIDRLISGAEEAAEYSLHPFIEQEVQFAILISCIGRRLVLKQLVEEEIEAVSQKLGMETTISGFYSYGEIAPFEFNKDCDLHNQTMTVTTFSEIT